MDSPWKEALEGYFEAFMGLFFPEAHAGIDWTRGYEFLDKELQQVVRDAESGRRHVDKLAKVWRNDGEEAWVLAHVEVQSSPERGFPKRMYQYNYRLFDRYDRPVASFAVLADDRVGWRPARYGYELWGCKAGLEFPAVKLLDYESRWTELEQRANPFAVLVRGPLKARATRRDPGERLKWKWTLVRELYKRGDAKEDLLNLFRFLDWLLALPDELERTFDELLTEYEEEKKMPYVIPAKVGNPAGAPTRNPTGDSTGDPAGHGSRRSGVCRRHSGGAIAARASRHCSIDSPPRRPACAEGTAATGRRRRLPQGTRRRPQQVRKRLTAQICRRPELLATGGN